MSTPPALELDHLIHHSHVVFPDDSPPARIGFHGPAAGLSEMSFRDFKQALFERLRELTERHERELRRARPDNDVFDQARAERARAHAKHGERSMESTPPTDPTGRRYRILCEEVGEIAQEFNDAEHDRRPVDLARLRDELIQVAAMAGAWADACDREIR